MEKIKNFIKDYKEYFIFTIACLIIFNINLPYYVMAPGGIIPIDDRIETEIKEDSKGSINLLYVTQYEGNVSSLLMSMFMKNWDVEKIEKTQLSDETPEEIHKRNQIMLENSSQSAIFVAYNAAGKEIKIKDSENIVIGVTTDNKLKINDKILTVNGTKVENINTLKEVVGNTEVGENIKLEIDREGEKLVIDVPVLLEDNQKIIGVAMITNYDYELDPEIEIKFKSSEGGSSGGVMMAVSIYNAITKEDITKGLNISGTGTIDIDGNVGIIDGVKYKIMGAVKNDMDIVFVPKDNYEEAIKTKKDNNYDIEIISVETFEDVINYLNNI